MNTPGELSLSPETPIRYTGFAGVVQSLDPQRPIERVAFDNIHRIEDMRGSDRPVAHEFLLSYFAARTQYQSQEVPGIAEHFLAEIYDYAHELAGDYSDNIPEISARVNTWEVIIFTAYDHYGSVGEELAAVIEDYRQVWHEAHEAA